MNTAQPLSLSERRNYDESTVEAACCPRYRGWLFLSVPRCVHLACMFRRWAVVRRFGGGCVNPPRQMPFGFEQDAGILCQLKLMKKYHCTSQQVHRWRAELGVDTNRKYKIPVLQIDSKTGDVLARYESLIAAGTAFGGSYQNINNAAKGIYKQAYGFKWRFDIAN